MGFCRFLLAYVLLFQCHQVHGGCPSPGMFQCPSTDVCVIYTDRPNPYNSQQFACMLETQTMAVINSQEKSDCLTQNSQIGMDEVWLEGLGVFLGVTWVSGSWQWEDGSPATSPSSGPALPADNSGGDCVVILKPSGGDWIWQATPCTTSAAGLCMAPATAPLSTQAPPRPQTSQISTAVDEVSTILSSITPSDATSTVEPTTLVTGSTSSGITTHDVTSVQSSSSSEDITTTANVVTESSSSVSGQSTPGRPSSYRSFTSDHTSMPSKNSGHSTIFPVYTTDSEHVQNTDTTVISTAGYTRESSPALTTGGEPTLIVTTRPTSTSVGMGYPKKSSVCSKLPDDFLSNANTILNLDGYVLTYTCLPGHNMEDETSTRTLVCNELDVWNTEVPKCKRVECALLRQYKGEYGSQIKAQCGSSQTYSNGQKTVTSQCTSLRKLSHSSLNIHCQGGPHCGPIPQLQSGDIVEGDAWLNSTVLFRCWLGYRFPNGEREMQMTCSEEGWIPDFPSPCLAITCPPSQMVMYADRDTDIAIYGTHVTFTCHLGYQYPDKETRKNKTCEDSGSWSHILPDCEEIHCAPPASGVDVIRYGDGTRAGIRLHYTCEPGLRFWDGWQNKTVTCQLDETWSEVSLDCAVDRCEPVPIPLQSTADTLSAEQGTVVNITCDTGHRWSDGSTSASITCDKNNQWQPQYIAPCEEISCPFPSNLSNAVLSSETIQEMYLYQDQVNYTCEYGYYWAEGANHISTCLANSTWSYIEACQPVECPLLQPQPNSMLAQNSSHYLSTSMVSCQHGYWMNRDVTTLVLTCTAEGVWKPVLQLCQEITCLSLPTWDGVVVNSSSVFVGSAVNYTCSDGYALESDTFWMESVCEEHGDWQPDVLACIKLPEDTNTDSPTEAPSSVNIGTTVASTMAVIFGLIVCLDIASYGTTAAQRRTVKSLRIRPKGRRYNDPTPRKRTRRGVPSTGQPGTESLVPVQYINHDSGAEGLQKPTTPALRYAHKVEPLRVEAFVWPQVDDT